MSNTVMNISAKTKLYWRAALEVIDAAGDYAAVRKLRANWLDKDTAWKVDGVVNEYYQGSLLVLDEAIGARKQTFYGKVEKFNILCAQYETLPIIRPDKLLDLLLDEKRRKSFRGKIERRRDKDIICPLQEFEQNKRRGR